jgi:hypothetical protein
MTDELGKAQKEAADMKATHDKAVFDATGLQVELDLLAGQASAQRSTLIKVGLSRHVCQGPWWMKVQWMIWQLAAR